VGVLFFRVKYTTFLDVFEEPLLAQQLLAIQDLVGASMPIQTPPRNLVNELSSVQPLLGFLLFLAFLHVQLFDVAAQPMFKRG
jgi:hypothetical protein